MRGVGAGRKRDEERGVLGVERERKSADWKNAAVFAPASVIQLSHTYRAAPPDPLLPPKIHRGNGHRVGDMGPMAGFWGGAQIPCNVADEIL